LTISLKNDFSYYQHELHHQRHQHQEQPNVQSTLLSDPLCTLHPSSLRSDSKRTRYGVGFLPGSSPSAAVTKRIADDSNYTNNCCISSLHDHFYPDNNDSFDSLAYNNNASPCMSYMTPIVSKKRRKLEPQEESQDTDEDGLALFGPIPTLQSFTSSSALDPTFNSSASSSSSFIDTTPPTICFDFDEETVIDDNNSILDDEMIFQELKWITNTTSSTTTTTTTTIATATSNNNSLPLSPPLSPSVQENLEPDLDDFILFPSL
jgi:hypothetical protein